MFAAMETFNTRVTANPENRQRAVIWLFQIIAAKASNTPSGMQMMVTTNGQTFPPCSFIKRLYLSSVERAPGPSGRGDRLIMMFIYVRVMAPIPNKSTPTTSMRTQPCDILTPRISCCRTQLRRTDSEVLGNARLSTSGRQGSASPSLVSRGIRIRMSP